jgi:lipoprotein-releasing system permease protein
MIISVAVVTGFQNEIRDKVIGFGSHIQISNFDSNNSFESSPIDRKQDFYDVLHKNNDIRSIQVFATKAGIIKTEEDIQGVVLKGVDTDYDWSFFKNRIIIGNPPEIKHDKRTNDILVSENICKALKFKLNDTILMFFIREGQLTPSARKFRISGIYNTGLEEFDKIYILGDIKHVQRLNNWDSTKVGGFEIIIKDFDKLDEVSDYVYKNAAYNLDSRNIKQMYPQIFEWLSFQDVNVIIIIVMMVFVALINMASTLLILIIEKTNMIGILKALGTRNWSIRKIFVYNAMYIIGKGLLWGNLLAISLCLIQLQFGLIKLDPASYYVSMVPINFSLINLLLINCGTVLVCFLVLIIPSYIITRISPVKAIRFD